ncbi:hypothetical protein HAV15_011544 [Penicillium sp. str. |nr:hypothetical protein HAV15_011544 [Penicillium sp. str. \
MPLQTRKPKKDGRKRTYSLLSNTTNTQAGPVASPKTVANSSPSQQPNGSRQALNAPAIPENPPQKPAEPARKLPNVFEFLEENEESSSDSSSASSSSSESESESDEEPDPPRLYKLPPRSSLPSHGQILYHTACWSQEATYPLRKLPNQTQWHPKVQKNHESPQHHPRLQLAIS